MPKMVDILHKNIFYELDTISIYNVWCAQKCAYSGQYNICMDLALTLDMITGTSGASTDSKEISLDQHNYIIILI